MKKRLLSITMASALLTSTAQAEIQLSGFASIVAGITTSSDETLYGYDDKFNFNQGSLFALQATSELGDKLGATVQILAKGEGDWEPEFNWAFLSYDATDDLRILAGRQRIPYYMYSDFLDVSYAFPWITPPEDVYSAPYDTFDGLGAIYNISLGNIDATFHGMYGNNNTDVPAGRATVKDMSGLTATFNYDWLTLRAAYFSFNNLSIEGFPLKGLSDEWLAEGYTEIAQSIDFFEDKISFSEIGFQMNFDKVSLITEYTELDIGDTLLPDVKSYYVMTNYRITDTLLIHLTYSVSEKTGNNYTSDISFGPSTTINRLKGTTETISKVQTGENKTVTLGLRYDFHDSAALKFEYTDYSDDINILNEITNVAEPESNDKGLIRIALVTIF